MTTYPMREYVKPRLSAEMQRQIEDGWRNDEEAHVLLDLINAEFQSDPTSQRCFDRRVVDRVQMCVARRKEHERRAL